MKPRAGTLVEEVLEILAASEEPLTRNAIYGRSEIAADEQDISRALNALKVRGEIVEVDQVAGSPGRMAWRYAIPGGAAARNAGATVAQAPVAQAPTPADGDRVQARAPALPKAPALHEAALRPNDRSDDDPAPRSALPAGRQAATPDMRFGVFDDGSLEIWSGTEILCRFDAQVVERLGQLLGRHAR